MTALTTNYAGLELKNPLIVGSSGLTNTVEKNVRLESAGAGALVLKSIFEEQIEMKANDLLKTYTDYYPEADDYLKTYLKAETITNYIKLIEETKKVCTIPVIASINCFSAGTWISFAKQIEAAGADALQLNIYQLSTDKSTKAEEVELNYYSIVKEVSKQLSIPVIVKLSPYFANMLHVINQVKSNGAKAVVLFNRFYQPDIDIVKMNLTTGDSYSSPAEFGQTLRWLAFASGKITQIDYAASTGIHTYEQIIKAILAGASSVEVTSAIYKQGDAVIRQMLTGVETWMKKQGYYTIDEFKGKFNSEDSEHHNFFERVQFMKYFYSH